MVIQSFLKGGEFGGICPLLFRDMGYFSKYLRGIWHTWDLSGPHNWLSLNCYPGNRKRS